ncbi:MAG: ATP-binding cassette domain-containing protein [Clostridia bacterium]|nr:ATP-binding cassette domain-containing protein [Clostridia bacterium]
MDYVIKTENLTKKFGNKIAVNSVNLNILRGEIYGFIGKNGAGKTTTMKMLLGTSMPTSGKIELFGSGELNKQRAKIGSLIEAPGLYKSCTAYENMKRFSILFGVKEEKIKELLEFVGLGNVGNKKVKAFSLGMKQRLGIAVALLGKPELLVLDEPINGLDPAGIKEIRDLILQLNKEKQITVLVSSHLLDELSKVVTKYGIINQGYLVEEITAEELNHRCRKYLSIGVDDAQKAVTVIQKFLPNVTVEAEEGLVKVFSELEDRAALLSKLVKSGLNVSDYFYKQDGFEDYFIKRLGV